MVNVCNFVAVPNCGNELSEVLADLRLSQSGLIDLLLEVTTLDVFLDQKLLVVAGVVNDLEQFDDVWVTHFLHDGSFFLEKSGHLLLRSVGIRWSKALNGLPSQLLFVDDLHSELFFGHHA